MSTISPGQVIRTRAVNVDEAVLIPAPDMVSVAICTPTFKRPERLRDLLTSIRQLDRDEIDLRIIVVDNDAERSAQTVVSDVMDESGISFTYDCVNEQSLPLARNRLVELAIGLDADWIWFLDDDQVADSHALQLMLRAANLYGAAGVIGRVAQTFEASDRPWAQWSGIFDDLHRPTGKRSHNFGTNGVLLQRKAVDQFPHPFDERLRLTGGSDGLFFARFRSKGFSVIGCDEAIIYDRVHASRNNPGWLTNRALRIGLVKGFIVREISPSILKSLRWIALGSCYAIGNLLVALVTLPLGYSRSFRYWIRAVRGYGIALGTLFPRLLLRRSEYRVVHGS